MQDNPTPNPQPRRPFALHEHTGWFEVLDFCEAVGWESNRTSKFLLAAELLTLAKLDEATVRKTLGE